ncbi:FkbM family methyltransferase [Anabaena sphaerica FACHB-251]|uniref:FkbM family methyltransferase n=1 Tax=Anabaena sphaerica FACHB-251 TaxID=2692883 RepID=A0A926WLT4_9NOST|nr:FkbM family methyltransferase [Anabaena sphaerica]MBD2296492.1 FkbM family methyltransferase [Anabaena sphaerica FACHB-251]
MTHSPFQRLLNRRDFQRNPLKAVMKRLWWRLRWKVTDQPYVIPFAETLKIVIPKTGSGAAIYYQEFSEPETADFLLRFLRPGMVMFDIGAHIGEYTLLAAKIVGASGQIYAFEPQSHLFPILSQSVEMNGFTQVVLNCAAVSDYVGEIEFQILDEPTLSSIRKQVVSEQLAKIVSVDCTSLDDYWLNQERKIDLIKVDVEGAEKFVFQGATRLLNLPSHLAPIWIFEYAPNSYADFGYQSLEILQLLKQYGYEVYQYCCAGHLEIFNPNAHLPDIINLIATKDRLSLLAQIQGQEYLPVIDKKVNVKNREHSVR